MLLSPETEGRTRMSHLSMNRRRFLASSALGAAALAAPAALRAQNAPVKVGILQPVSGAMSYSGQQGRIGATLALEELNASGIKSLGGAKIVPRGLKNTFRFGPGFGVVAKAALDNLIALNDAAGKPAKTVMIVHEDSAF